MKPPPIPTMEDLPSLGVTHIRVWCGRWPHACDHQGTVPVEGLDLRQTIVEFAAKLRCEKCGTVGGQAMPGWPMEEATHVWDAATWRYVPK
jgi:hypothetical protein